MRRFGHRDGFGSTVFEADQAFAQGVLSHGAGVRNAFTLNGDSLHEPCFDIYYHHRQNGMTAILPQPISYAFIVSVKAPKIPDLYNRVVRAYSSILLPLRPQLRFLPDYFSSCPFSGR